MDLATFEQLLSPAGQEVLGRAATLLADGADPLRAGELVRRALPAGASPDLAAAALGVAGLRLSGAAKLGPDAVRLYLTPDGLQQATRPEVAGRRAARLAAGLGLGASVVDLGCGVGADLVSLARAGLAVTGVERDPVTAAMAAANLEAVGLPGTVTAGDATAVDRSAYDGAFADPARRTARGRVFDVDAYSPPWSFVEEVLAGPPPACVKVAPGIPHDRVPPGVEAEWMSVDGEVKEAALWGAGLADAARRATLLRRGDDGADPPVEVTDADDPGAVATGPVGRWLVEPDGAVIRAGLVAAVAAAVDGWLPDEHIAYVSTDTEPHTPLGRGYEVLETLPFGEKHLRRALRERGVGRLTIKKRGVGVVPEDLRRRLALRGDREATLVLTRVAGRGTALLVQPLA